MSKFSEKCRELLAENGYNVYRFSQIASLERTTLQRMVTGKRLPSPEFVEHFCQALRISLTEKKEVMDLYKMESIGETAYQNQTLILQLFEKLSILEKNKRFNNQSVVNYGEIKLISPVSTDKYETELLLQYVLRKTLQEQESPELYTNLPGANSLLPHYLNLLVPEYNKTILIKHLIHFQPNASYAYENLETLHQIIPLCFSSGINYIPFYYYSKLSQNDQPNLLYPFYIITEKYVLQLTTDLSKGILHSDPVILQEYTKEFQNCLKHSAPLLQQSKDPAEALQLYLTSFDTVQTLTGLASTPCDMDSMDDEYFFHRVKETSPEYIPLMKTYAAYLDGLKQVSRHTFFTSNGVQKFCECGISSGTSSIVIPNFSPKERLTSLKYFLEHFSNESHQMLNSNFSYPDSLFIELRNNHSLFLINLADKTNISFIIIQESSICNAFSEFFRSLTDSEFITPENQTRTLIQKYIEQLKQLTSGVTPPLEIFKFLFVVFGFIYRTCHWHLLPNAWRL